MPAKDLLLYITFLSPPLCLVLLPGSPSLSTSRCLQNQHSAPGCLMIPFRFFSIGFLLICLLVSLHKDHYVEEKKFHVLQEQIQNVLMENVFVKKDLKVVQMKPYVLVCPPSPQLNSRTPLNCFPHTTPSLLLPLLLLI